MLFAGWEVRMVKNCDRNVHPSCNPFKSNLNFKSNFT